MSNSVQADEGSNQKMTGVGVGLGVDTARVPRLFSNVSALIASEFLRREVSARMQERLDLVRFMPDTVLDAGCGSGRDLLALAQRYPKARLTGVDLSPSHIEAARARSQKAMPTWQHWLDRLTGKDRMPQWHCGDLAQLPPSDQSVGLLWSNLALHWHPQPAAVFAEWARVVQTDGLLMFTCFGPDTFCEVRRAFAGVDTYPHTLSFTDMHDLGDGLLASGFATPVMDMEKLTVTYQTAEQLIADVRAFGGNPLLGRRRGLMSRAQGKAVRQALESTRTAEGSIDLTFEVIYGHAFKPAPTRTQQGEAIVRMMPRR